MHNLQRQHRKLQKMAGELIALSYKPFGASADIQRSLARFSGTLKVHASMEAEGLYPELLNHDDVDVRARTEALHRELGPLYDKWEAFMARWHSANAIHEEKMKFRLDLAKTLRTLGKRMQKEDRELYPMVEQHLV